MKNENNNSTIMPVPGDIVFADFGEEGKGAEVKGCHPAVVVSSAKFNRITKMCLACPIVREPWNKDKAIYLSGEYTRTKGYIIPDQMRSVDCCRESFRIFEKCPKVKLLELRKKCLQLLITSVGHRAGDLCQGDFVYVDLEKRDGRELGKRRPALVISNERMNGRCFMVCPITSTERNFYGEVKVPEGLQTTGVIRCDQIRALDVAKRHFDFRGCLPLKETEEVIRTVTDILRE